jgi:hypothetical protein
MLDKKMPMKLWLYKEPESNIDQYYVLSKNCYCLWNQMDQEKKLVNLEVDTKLHCPVSK